MKIELMNRPTPGNMFLGYGEYYRGADGEIIYPWYAKDGKHKGEDYVANLSPVYATHDGVAIVGNSAGWGNYAKVRADGWETISAHLDHATVKSGQKVKAGEQIAVSGQSGSAEGNPHLHFELRACGLELLGTGPKCQQNPAPFYVAQPPSVTPPPDWKPPDVTPPPFVSHPAEAFPPLDKWQCNITMRVVAQVVNVRTWPNAGNDALIVGQLRYGDSVEVSEVCVGYPTGLWAKHENGYSAISYYGTVYLV